MLLTVPDDYSLETVGLTQSLIKAYKNCKILFLFNINRFEPIYKTDRFTINNAIHSSLESFYKSNGKNDLSDLIKILKEYGLDGNLTDVTDIEQVKNDLEGVDFSDAADDDKEIFIKYGLLEEEAKPCDDKLKTEFEKAKINAIMDKYKEIYKNDTLLKNKNAEITYKKLFNEVLYLGKTDLEFSDKNKIYLMDHKFLRNIATGKMEFELAYDFQSQFYDFLRENIYYCFIYNVIRNPMNKETDDPNKYFKKLTKLINEKPDYYFYRFTIHYSNEKRKMFVKELENLTNEIKLFLKGIIKPYKNENHCTNKYGECLFHQVCLSDNLSMCTKRKEFFPELETEKIDE